MIRVSVIGATGYAGQELVKIICQHPQVELRKLVTNSYKGLNIDEIYPYLTGFCNILCSELDIEAISAESDAVFIALPHGHSTAIVPKLLARGIKVIDLGADFRLKDKGVYEEWYQEDAPSNNLLEQAVYGLSELSSQEIANGKLIANPGCYPTSIILALAPLLKEGLIDLESIIIDSKSGVTGAGRSASVNNLYCEINEGFKAYGIPRHRHTPEIEQALSQIAKNKITVTFTPHLLPINRGILSTIYGKLIGSISIEKVSEIYKIFYSDKPFIRIRTGGNLPQIKWVAGTNLCDIGFVIDERTQRLIIVSAIDNLVKGAAGQAVQNMNLMFGLKETTGLLYPAVNP